MLNKFYAGIASILIVLYGVAAFSGWDFGASQRQTVPADQRKPGWSRSGSSFWHAGYRGGK